MPYLRWRRTTGAEVPGGSSVLTGKEVLLSGDAYETPPGHFFVQRRFGVLLRRYREHRGMPITAPVGQPLPVTAIGEEEAGAGPWVLRTPGRRMKWRLFFEDEDGNNSEELHVSRLGMVRSLGLEGLEAGASAEFEFTAAIDPRVKVSVLTPWNSEAGLRPFLQELAEDVREEGESDHESFAALTEHWREYLPLEEPPGWGFELEREEFDLDEGESISFGIRVNTPTAGAAAFSIQLSAEVDGELLTVASDPLVVRMPEDGSQQAELFGGDNLSGDDAAEDEIERSANLATAG